MTKLATPLKTHGGKHYLAAWIAAKFPPHIHYVEPYAGGLSVLLAKDPEGVSEVVNDIDGLLTNFWRVLQGRESRQALIETLSLVPFSEPEFDHAKSACEQLADRRWGNVNVDVAVKFFVLARQSLAGRQKHFAPLSRTRTRRGMNEQVSAWMSAIDGLETVGERLRRVVVLNRPALDVIHAEDAPSTLFYLDPPYLGETRTSKQVYRHEMTPGDHLRLLDRIKSAESKVAISGYSSPTYEDALRAWNRHEYKTPNHSSGGASKRTMTECLWTNY